MDEITDVAVIGAGRMGHGIALAFALGGHSVALTDADEGTLESSRDRIDDALEMFVDGGKLTDAEAVSARENVTREADFGAAVASADLVTEAVVEDLEIKRAVFERLDEQAPGEAVLATNTSSLSIDDIAAPVADRSRVLGTHWFNPPYLVPLVEIVKGSATDDGAVAAVRETLDAAGKTPIVVRKDIPGFIGNRIQMAMCYEAFSLLHAGVASAADIDRAVKAGFGFRLPLLGIFEKVDYSGIDIHHAVEEQLMDELDRGTEPNPVIEELLGDGANGVDTGRGVYDWTGVDVERATRERDEALLSLLELYERVGAESSPPANYE